MKKTGALLGTLAAATSLIASSAMADTSSTTLSATAPRLIDKITASYWGAYSGPSVGSPSRKTLDSDTAELTDIQNLDSTLTVGYKLKNPDMSLNANYRFIYKPMTAEEGTMDLQTKDPWLSFKHNKLVHMGNLNMSADLRGYIPVGTGRGKIVTGIRSTQTTTYDIPKTRLTLGTYTIERANWLREGSPVENFNLDLAVLANYQMTSTLALTGWSDLLQYDIKIGTDLANKPVDVALGVNWDITPNFSVNPQFTFFPQSVTLDNTTIGAIISAKFL
jgi:hypothetical protein